MGLIEAIDSSSVVLMKRIQLLWLLMGMLLLRLLVLLLVLRGEVRLVGLKRLEVLVITESQIGMMLLRLSIHRITRGVVIATARDQGMEQGIRVGIWSSLALLATV